MSLSKPVPDGDGTAATIAKATPTTYWQRANDHAGRLDRAQVSALAKQVIDGKLSWLEALSRLDDMIDAGPWQRQFVSGSALQSGVYVGSAGSDGVRANSKTRSGASANTTLANGRWGFYTLNAIHSRNILLHSLSVVALKFSPAQPTRVQPNGANHLREWGG